MSQKNTLFSYFGQPSKRKSTGQNPCSAEHKVNGADGKRSRDSACSPSEKKECLKNGTSDPPPEKKLCLDNGSPAGVRNLSSPRTPAGRVRSAKESPPGSSGSKKKFKRIMNGGDSSDDSDVEQDSVNSSENSYKKNSASEIKLAVDSALDGYKRNGNSDLREATSDSGKEAKEENIPLGQASKQSAVGEDKGETETADEWTHLKLEFLKPENIRDADKRKPTDPNYNAKTLFVPESFKKTLTPAMRQWWEIKSNNFDSVIFFKVGKFYELYHMDAVIGFQELGLAYMKGDHAHSGFPEMAFGKFSADLIHKGYKVARVEQTETPEMMEQRCSSSAKKTTKYDKVVRREVCQLITKGTITFGPIDVDIGDNENHYLLSLTEMVGSCVPVFGVCFIDTSIGTFNFGQFSDDRHRSRLRTLLAHHPPVQVLLEKDSVSQEAQKIIGSIKSVVRKDVLLPRTEFWTAEETLVFLREGQYFTADDVESDDNQNKYFPKAFWQYLNSADPMGLSANSEGELAIKALGACIWYLKECVVLDRILSLKQFSSYLPVDAVPPVAQVSDEEGTVKLPENMILDGAALKNLNILGDNESLYKKLDYCVTPFGKRLLRLQVCNPLCNRAKIIAKQKAVGILVRNGELAKEVRAIMRPLPDLERRLTKIHTFGNSDLHNAHPDERAIFYEDKIYSKRKIIDFISTLNAFKTAVCVGEMFRDCKACEESLLLKRYTFTASKYSGGIFPDMSEDLKFFEGAFDHEKARTEGVIIPEQGVDEQYDKYISAKLELERETKSYLEEQKRFFREKVTYVGSGKKAYQLEVPEHACKRATDEYQLVSQRKGYKRYVTEDTQSFLAKASNLEDLRKEAINGINKKIFQKFSSKTNMWMTAVKCLAELDVLLSLAEYTRNIEEETCIPRIMNVTVETKPYVRLLEGRHPCISWVEKFVPNDVTIGCDDVASLIVLTGPNMGGKSTLMRQLALLVIMAQMGCHVPAASFELTLVDRIFTRIGARDDAMAGESTFYIELSETATICAHATEHSLVLVDELGRGTSTYDGCAVACAVINRLRKMKCRTIFSTHYHLLVDSFKDMSDIYFAHMACAVENEGADDPTEEMVTFLYKFVKGVCPKSYGFNAAKLGGISTDIIRVAFKKAEELGCRAEKRKLCKKVFSSTLDVKNCISLLQTLAH
ncbi:DNA mismatch repair protein Msh6 isoform X1 [Schistocerca serialis cubense]|uniref:DNA mismatch repair protein Msh6 isoform X1 n=1 Tax=Schistocerca serialis cubense TaxID=2023355 RepID=UPI00214F47FD|nr:DNA mismatch repair protein Msh6 isoform X1 [Schistocerca serialis cubense]